GPCVDKSLGGVRRQIRTATEVALGPPVAREAGAHKDGRATQVAVWEDIRADRATGAGDVDDGDGKVGEALEGKSSKVRALPKPMPRRVDVGSRVAAQVQRGDQELRLAVVPRCVVVVEH